MTESSLKVGVHIPQNPILLKNLLVNFYRPENHPDMSRDSFIIPSKRKITSIFLLKLNSFDMKGITMHDLFVEVLLRWPMEQRLGDRVWTMKIEEILLSFDEAFFTAMIEDWFQNPPGIDISPILVNSVLFMTSSMDGVSDVEHSTAVSDIKANSTNGKFLSKIRDIWRKFVPLHDMVLFHEFSPQKISLAIKRAAGFVKVTEKYGMIVADSAVAEVSQIDKSIVEKIRYRLLAGKSIFLKYIAISSEKCPNHSDYKKLMEFYESNDMLLAFIEGGRHGLVPLVIPGHSFVWHRKIQHRFNIIGRHNPILLNMNIHHMLEANKYFEYRWWKHFCGDQFMPRSKLLSHLLEADGISKQQLIEDPNLFVSTCNKHFPNGWVAKDAMGYNSPDIDDGLATHRVNFTERVLHYRQKSSQYERIINHYSRVIRSCEPVEDLDYHLKDHPEDYLGWKYDGMVPSPERTLIQEIMNATEFRVECLLGSCPLIVKKDDDYYEDKLKLIPMIREMLHQCLSSLPIPMSSLPMTADILVQMGGSSSPAEISIKAIDTNCGGDGSLQHVDRGMTRSLQLYVQEYYQNNGKDISAGYSNEMQIEIMKKLLEHFDMMKSFDMYFPGYSFLKDKEMDPYSKPHRPRLSRMNTNQTVPTALPVPIKFNFLVDLFKGFIKNGAKKLCENNGLNDCLSLLRFVVFYQKARNAMLLVNLLQN